jgi:hypothetical protein
MNIIVHIHKSIEKHGHEWATRHAWKCGEKALEVTRIIGVSKSKIVCIIDGVTAEKSTIENNPKHDDNCEGRYVFLGGKCWTEFDFNCDPMTPVIMGKKVDNLSQGHRYFADEELLSNII